MPETSTSEAAEATAVLVSPFLGSLTSPLRVQRRPLRTPLRYRFAVDYRAWVEVVQLHERSRVPMVLARTILGRALFELWAPNFAEPSFDGSDLAPGLAAEKAARDAKRRRRAWMTVNGRRYLGVGADGHEYRSVAVRLGDQLVVAVVPTWQEEIVVELVSLQAGVEQRRAFGEAVSAEAAAA